VILNPALTSFEDLVGLESATLLGVERNASLTNLDGLENLTSLVALSLVDNDALQNVDGLSGVTAIERLTLGGEVPPDLHGLDNVETIRELVVSQLNSTSLDWLPTTAGLILVELNGNPTLVDLSALDGVTTLQTIAINDNDALTDLSAFGALTTLNQLNVVNNGALTSLHALAPITFIRSILFVSGNSSLPMCEVLWFRDHLVVPPQSVNIGENGPIGGCP
jgi:Leucine-rich repeat (LRR) protein